MQETIETIMKWHAETFPDATFDGQWAKFKDEETEYYETSARDINNNLAELADMFIVACGLARFSTVAAAQKFALINQIFDGLFSVFDFQCAINNKMRINRARKWEKQNGKYQHVETGK